MLGEVATILLQLVNRVYGLVLQRYAVLSFETAKPRILGPSPSRRPFFNCIYFNQTPRLRPSTPREQPQIPDAIDRRQPPNRANANHRHGASKAFPECLISIRDQTE